MALLSRFSALIRLTVSTDNALLTRSTATLTTDTALLTVLIWLSKAALADCLFATSTETALLAAFAIDVAFAAAALTTEIAL